MTRAGLEAWLDAYGAAWRAHDPEAAARLFSDDAAYHETPFIGPARGPSGIRAYWAAATRSQEEIRFSHEILELRDARGIVRWRCRFRRRPSGIRVELDGIFLLEFDADGRCRSLREWWHRRDLPQRRPAGRRGRSGVSSAD